MVYQKRRQKLGAKRGEEYVVMQDYWRKTEPRGLPAVLRVPAVVKDCCSRHNAVKTLDFTSHCYSI
jgi:hypothetical protein